MINNDFKHRITNTERIAQLRRIDPAAAVGFWKQVCVVAGRDLTTYEVLTLLLAQGERASTIPASELATAPPSDPQPEESANTVASHTNETPPEHTLTNTGKIARLRRIGTAAAVDYWKKVCTAAGDHLTTYDVLMLLLAQGERASTISAQDLATTSASNARLEEPAIASPIQKSPSSRQSETLCVIAKPAVTPSLNYTHEVSRAHCKAGLAERHDLSLTEADELYTLLKEMRPLGFTQSKQLSNYITSHKMGYKYPNISGIVRMKGEGNEWNFDGGFPTRIYRVICHELGLSNQGTTAKAVGFISFKELQLKKMLSHR